MKKLSILFAAFAVLFLVSCGKYEDGPGFSLRSKSSRIAGSWTIDKKLENGVDVTSEWVGNGIDHTYEFTKDGAYKSTTTYGSGIVNVEEGSWELTNNDEDLTVIYSNPSSTWTDTLTYKILRLTNSEMWYSRSNGTETLETHLKAK
jgi:hypothetical protein